MNWLDLVKALGLVGASQTILFLLVIFLGKWVFEYFANGIIELRKLELAKNIEDYKSKIEIVKLEHQIKYSGLYSKRSDIIAELYKKLVAVQHAMLNQTQQLHIVFEDGEKETQERIQKAVKSFDDFKDFFYVNKIYFPSIICESVDELLGKYWTILWDSTEHRRQRGAHLELEERKEMHEKAKKARGQITE